MTPRPKNSAAGQLVIIIFLGLAVRIATMLLSRSYLIPPQLDHWSFGFETGRIARSLATGHGFSSQFPQPGGPTAWMAPGYPLLLAGIFRIFGVYTAASAVAAYLLNCLLSILTCIALYRLGERLFGRETGLLAAFLLALYPPSIWHAVTTIWDTTLLGLALVGLLAWLYGLPRRLTAAHVAETGLFMGLIVLINPAPLIFYPVIAIEFWRRLKRSGSSGYREIALLAGVCLLVFLPWMIRNALRVGIFAPRSGGGSNLRMGNSDGAFRLGTGEEDVSVYPANSARENRLFQQMGEAAYDRYCARLALDYIRNHPGRFAALTWMRIRAWWLGQPSPWQGNLKLPFGLSGLKRLAWLLPLPFGIVGCIAAWRRHIGIGLVLALLFIYPIPYYFTVVVERYHYPVEPFLVLLTAYGLVWSYQELSVHATLRSRVMHRAGRSI